MRLAVSNLALPAGSGATEWQALASAGVSGVEFAPTRIAPWPEWDAARAVAYRTELTSYGLSIPSLQAIFFGTGGLSLLGDADAFEAMHDHVSLVARLAEQLDTGVAVFGAPHQRARRSMAEDEAFALGAERLTRLAATAYRHGLILGLEPVPAAYNGDFLPTWQEVHAMVKAVGHPGLRVHLDTGCVLLGGGSISDAIQTTAAELCHFHIAEPKLGPFAQPQAEHSAAAAALKRISFGGWLAIEMLEQQSNAFGSVMEATTFVQHAYEAALAQRERREKPAPV